MVFLKNQLLPAIAIGKTMSSIASYHTYWKTTFLMETHAKYINVPWIDVANQDNSKPLLFGVWVF